MSSRKCDFDGEHLPGPVPPGAVTIEHPRAPDGSILPGPTRVQIQSAGVFVPKKYADKFLASFHDCLQPGDVAEIVKAMVSKAKEGNETAAKLVLKYAIGEGRDITDLERVVL